MKLGLICILLLSGILFAMSQTVKPTTDSSPQPTKNGPQQDPLNALKPAPANDTSWSSPTHKALYEDIRRLELFRYSNDLDGLILTADELEQKWSPIDGEFYARVMLNVSNLILNGGFDDTRIKPLSQRYARKALVRSEKFPLELEEQLLLFVQEDLNPANSEAWMKERSAKAKLWLHAWRRLEKGIDPNFDFNNRALLSVAPPLETGLPAGIAPEAIKDPKLRAQYEAAITANEEKGRRYDQQYRLRVTGKYLPNEAEQYLIRAYSKPPYNLEELKGYLDDHLADETLKTRIVNEVKKNMSSK
jgi:hypothetical protein